LRACIHRSFSNAHAEGPFNSRGSVNSSLLICIFMVDHDGAVRKEL
jgi:hypothetical protein